LAKFSPVWIANIRSSSFKVRVARLADMILFLQINRIPAPETRAFLPQCPYLTLARYTTASPILVLSCAISAIS
jgi:hypothetical protein